MLPTNAIAGPVNPQRPTAPWNSFILIGEAPGRTEAITGLPFAGPAGRLLDQCLAQAGQLRQATLIANVFRYQPTWTAREDGRRRNNDINTFFTDDPAEAATDIPLYHARHLHLSHAPDVAFLAELIASVKPTRIVALGSIALWALTGQDRIRENRGKVMATSLSDAPVFPTYHTAYALHKDDPEIATLIAADLKAAFS